MAQEGHHAEIVPALLLLLSDNSHPRLRARAAKCLVDFTTVHIRQSRLDSGRYKTVKARYRTVKARDKTVKADMAHARQSRPDAGRGSGNSHPRLRARAAKCLIDFTTVM